MKLTAFLTSWREGMPTGPKGEKRKADVIGNFAHIMRIATGEVEDATPDDGKDKATQAMGRKVGAARAASMTAVQRAEIAKKAAVKRWGKSRHKPHREHECLQGKCSRHRRRPCSTHGAIRMSEETPQSKGGKARAERLSPEERALSARVAAMKRWDPDLPKAVSGGDDTPIRIAGIQVPCYVLEDDRRVIATSGMLDTLQLARGGSMVRGMNRLELFVSRDRIKPFVSNELLERIRNPIRFRIGNNVANGYTSDTLIDIAEAVIIADNSERGLQKQQAAIAYQCRVITAALTRIGLIALIDEATGHQTKREKDALQQILTAYLLPEHRPWMKTIPDDFTKEIYRVYGWTRTANNRGPRYAGKLIRQLIYERLPKPVLPALDQRNPADAKYRRKHKHHSFLTLEQGLDHFRTQVITVMTLLRISRNKAEFKRNLRAYFSNQTEMDFDGL
ncbi:MAG: P63C domain-containing protein [Methylocystis sp.]|nr:P63C domain-containing protein [Methylocystis sp.]MCA3588493.1 P63C domain-containing protein [Methylocystis sp.]MCA3592074.1 P63C domain-containing protein [Methylocystis sp.]